MTGDPREPLVVDLHMDTPTASLADPAFDLAEWNETGHVDRPRLRAGGVAGAFFVAWIEPWWMERPGGAFRRVRGVLEETRRRVEATPGLRLARGAREVREAGEAGETAILLAVEGGHAIEGSLERLRELAELGVRYMTLTWNHSTAWADACCSPAKHGGLTPFGRSVIREMEDLRVLPDLSHAADSTFWDVLEMARAPVLVSHSCARALCDHPRNVTDEMARAVGEKGGVIGVNFYPGFLDESFARIMKERWGDSEEGHRIERILDPESEGDPEDRERTYRRLRDAMTERLRGVPCPLESLVRHVEHLVEVAGVDHVALGSDFDGVPALPEGLGDVSRIPVLAEALRGRGFTEDEVQRILGGNVLRILEG